MRINATLAVNSILTHNISLRAGQPCLILHSDEKVRLAEEFARQLALRGCSAEDLFLPKAAIDSTDWVAGVRNRLTHFGGARIILLDHWMVQSPIMDVIGRPDQGVALSGSYYCDWSIPMDSLIRIHSADYDELMEYQRKLLDNLNEGAVLTVTTKNGTRIGFKAQGWNVDSTEVNTSPTTESFSGRIVYDGSLFYGRPAHLVTVVVDMGQILNLNCEDPDDEQFTMFRNCMNTDPGAAAIAEFGIGLNPTADPFGHGMEAEMSRRTCHVDFGNAMPFGGQNRSAIHYGGTVFEPTIGVDGKEIMRSGVLVGLKDVV